ncbi:MAG: hypothetical protein ACRENQ_15100 [Gemmatimonadaceae bacterium]
MPQLKHTLAILATLAVAGIAACSNDTAPATSTVTDASLTADLAVSAGDAIATDVSDMVGNEQYSTANSNVSADAGATDSSSLTRTRTRTCYDASGNVVTCGQGLTASAVVTLQLDGFWTGNQFTAIVHRQRHDSISGIGAGSTARTHNGYGISQDTTTYTRDVTTRVANIAASDTTMDLVFNLPHANNPWPVSGQVIRNMNATFIVTKGATKTRTILRRAVVTFPADAEGNVPIEVGTLSCTLNLVTHKVTGCTGG